MKHCLFSSFLSIVITCVFFCPYSHAATTWQQTNGPYGGNVESLAIDPITPQTVYAGTSGGVFKSINGGASWSAVNTGITNLGVKALVIDPSTPQTVYAGTTGGVFKTVNGGTSWSTLISVAVLSITIDPSTSQTVYVGTYNGIYKSINGGGTWSLINTGLTDKTVWSLAIDPSTPQRVYAGTSGGVFKSGNSGINWSAVNTGLPSSNKYVYSLEIDPLTPQTVYAGTTGGLFKSVNSGGSWSSINSGLTDITVLFLAIDASAPQTIYAGTNGGVFKSINGGGTWSTSNTGLSPINYTKTLAIDSSTPQTVYAGTTGGVFKSINGGGLWNTDNTGLTSTITINSIVINSTTPQILYAATEGGGIFKSTDSGTSWNDVNTGLTGSNIRAITIDPSTPQTIYAGTGGTQGGSVFKSIDGGGNWKPINAGLTGTSIYALIIDSSNSQTVYTSAGGVLFKTVDGGDNWIAINTGLITHSIASLVIDPSSPQTLYAGTYGGGVFKSVGGGGDWVAVNSGLSEKMVFMLAIDPSFTQTLYAGTSAGVFKSVNGGASWIAFNTGLTNLVVKSLAISPPTPQTIYAGTTGGVFKSINGGVSWSPINVGLTNLDVQSLAIDPFTPQTVYAGTTGGTFKTLINVTCGASSGGTFTIAPSTDLCADGAASSVTGTGPWSWSCTVLNGDTDNSCTASIQAYNVIANVNGGNGSVSCATPVNYGSNSLCTIYPTNGFQLATFSDNTVEQSGIVSDNIYTIFNIAANHTIVATFSDNQKPLVTDFTVFVTGTSLTVELTSLIVTDNVAVTGYLITESSISPSTNDSGWSTTVPSSYTVSSSGNKTLYAWAKDAVGNVSTPASATFIICSITASSDTNGRIILTGSSIFSCNQNRLYNMTPKPGYKIANVMVDNISVGAINSYLFSNVTSTHTIAASFTPDDNVNWSSISAGNNHSAAIRSGGTLWAWGTNNGGQVGDGSVTNRSKPVQVGNKINWDAVSAGNRFTLGHRTDGSVWSWGDNSYGQLGDTTTTGKIIPQMVGSQNNWSSIAAGGLTDNYPIGASNPAYPGHSAALQSDGSLLSWGYNPYGEIGNNSTSNVSSPVTTGTAGIQYVDASTGGNHTIGLRADGTLWGWGRNDWGQLGVSSQLDKSTPTRIGSNNTWIAVAAGYEHTLAIKSDGSLWGWGRNDQGQIGVESSAYSITPLLIDNTTSWKAIAAGGYQSLAIKNDGTLWAFGRNLEGQLGDGTGATKSYPVQVGSDSDWAKIEAGELHSLALKTNGTMYAWGANAGGQLGDTTTSDRLSPVLIGTNTNNFLIHSSVTTAGGNISPLGNVNVTAGTSKSYTISPLVGYYIDDVLVDGVSQGIVTSYTFSNVASNYTISASFIDNTAPNISDFSLPANSNSLNVAVSITASDNSGSITSYCLNESNNNTICNWTVLKPTNYTFGTTGNKTLYAFAKDADGNISESLSANVFIPFFLSVTISGTGSGSVHSSPMTEISCIKGSSDSCTGRFGNIDVTLTASPVSTTSIFDGWTDACTTMQKDCVVNMNSDKTATATFTSVPKSKLDLGATTGFDTLQSAYSSAVSTIFALEGLFSGEWMLDKGTNITLKGGYLADYGATRNGFTILNGKLTIKNGSLKVDGVKVRPNN